jgi:hypothetical protein
MAFQWDEPCRSQDCPAAMAREVNNRQGRGNGPFLSRGKETAGRADLAGLSHASERATAIPADGVDPSRLRCRCLHFVSTARRVPSLIASVQSEAHRSGGRSHREAVRLLTWSNVKDGPHPLDCLLLLAPVDSFPTSHPSLSSPIFGDRRTTSEPRCLLRAHRTERSNPSLFATP